MKSVKCVRILICRMHLKKNRKDKFLCVQLSTVFFELQSFLYSILIIIIELYVVD